MSFERLFQPKTNPFGLYIYSFHDNTLSFKQFSQEKICSSKLANFKGEGTYCNSYTHLFISEGKDFWVINNTSYQIRYKTMPIEKKNHSMIFVNCDKSCGKEGKIFIIGGNDKKAFFYDLKKNYFLNWAPTNEIHLNPALIKVGEYLYLIDTAQNKKNFCFERTKLNDDKPHWEKIIPNVDQNIINNFPTNTFGVSLDAKNKIVFIGGDNITMGNNATYIYDISENKICLSEKGTNDSMNFCDKNFYQIDNKFNIALPENLFELKEIAVIDKNEQSLIKKNIDDNIQEKLCSECKKEKNMNKVCYKINKKYDNEPKEFGYYISSCSSEQSKIKAKNDKIKVIEFNKNNKKYTGINTIVKQNINIEQKQIQIKEENIENNKHIEQIEQIQEVKEVKEEKEIPEEVKEIKEENVEQNMNIEQPIEENIQENIETNVQENIAENQEIHEENEEHIEQNKVNEVDYDQQEQGEEQGEEEIQQNEEEIIQKKEKIEEIPQKEEIINTDINQQENNNIYIKDSEGENNVEVEVENKEIIEGNEELPKEPEPEQDQVQEIDEQQNEQDINGEEEENHEEQIKEHYEEQNDNEEQHEEQNDNEEQIEGHYEENNGELMEHEENNEQQVEENVENVENAGEEFHEEQYEEQEIEQHEEHQEENEHIENIENEGEEQVEEQMEEHIEQQNEEIEVNNNNNIHEHIKNIEENRTENINEIGEEYNQNQEEKSLADETVENKVNNIENKINQENQVDAKVYIQMQNQLEFNNAKIQTESQKESKEVENQIQKSENREEQNEHEEINVLISQEKNEISSPGGEGGDEIHHEDGEEIHRLHHEDEEINENEDNLEHIGQYYEGDEEAEEDQEGEEGMLQEDEEHVDNTDENNEAEFIHENEEEQENAEAEEMHFDEEENNEEEYDENDEQNEERDTIQKTLTQNIGEDVMQIPEQPINIYFDPDNFCDYTP